MGPESIQVICALPTPWGEHPKPATTGNIPPLHPCLWRRTVPAEQNTFEEGKSQSASVSSQPLLLPSPFWLWPQAAAVFQACLGISPGACQQSSLKWQLESSWNTRLSILPQTLSAWARTPPGACSVCKASREHCFSWLSAWPLSEHKKKLKSLRAQIFSKLGKHTQTHIICMHSNWDKGSVAR